MWPGWHRERPLAVRVAALGSLYRIVSILARLARRIRRGPEPRG